MASLVDQILAQAGAGSAQGQGFGEFAVQGVQLGQNQQRLNLLKQQQERQERREDMLLPMQQQAAANNLAIQGYQLKDMARQQDLYTKNEAAYSELADFITKGLEAGKAADPQFGTQIATQMMRYPTLAQDPRALNLLKLYNDSAQTYHQILKAQRPDHQAMSMLGKLQTERQAALAAGDMETVKLYDARIAKENATSKGMTVYDPSTGNPIMTTGGDNTVAIQTQMQQKMGSAAEFLSARKAIMPLMRTGTMGIPGGINRAIGAAAGQFPELFKGILDNPNIQDAQKFSAAAANLESLTVKSMKTDSQISETERKAWQRVPPSISLTDNAATAEQRLNQLAKAVVGSYRRSATELGRPIPVEALTPAELLQRFEGGQMDYDTFAQHLRNSPFEDEARQVIEELRQKGGLGGR